jgi:hypothetical protein
MLLRGFPCFCSLYALVRATWTRHEMPLIDRDQERDVELALEASRDLFTEATARPV